MPVTIELSPAAADLIGGQFLHIFEETFPLLLPEGRFSIEVEVYDADAMRTLNRDTRSIDAPTDVLSYPTVQDPDLLASLTGGTSDTVPLGTIVICPPKALAYGEPLWELICHGFLHLIGADHETDMIYWKQKEGDLIGLLAQHHVQLRSIPAD